MCLNPLDGSSLADARASDSASATNYRFSLLELTFSNDRWISQLHWHLIDRRETAARKHSPAGFPSRVDPKFIFSYGGQIDQQPENLPVQWYVDTSCALCRTCLEAAPNLITYNRDETVVHFFKQAETSEETDAVQRAMEVCPTLAIRNDG